MKVTMIGSVEKIPNAQFIHFFSKST